jgi:hypothetical protein
MQLYANNAASKLDAPVSAVGLTLQVKAGDGALFPNPTGGDFFMLTLSKVASGVENTIEITKCTARVGDVLTIVRAQEGTTASAYTVDDRAELRMTAATPTAYEAHVNSTANPHATTKAQVGLGNVDNTSDANKPVSTAQATALGLKADLAGAAFTGPVTGITKAMVGLGNVDNTSDANKPVSTAQATALGLKADLTGATFSGAVAAASFSGAGTGLTGTAAGLTAGNASAVTWAGVSGKPTTLTGYGITDGLTANGADATVQRYMFKDTGTVFFDSAATNALDYVNGSCQRWAPNSGAQTLSIANWPPTGNLGELLIQGVNLGAATITWPTINWIKNDGTTTTTFSSNGVTLQSSGTDWILLWTRDGGTTIYGKVVR